MCLIVNAGDVKINSNTPSSSATTGALVVTGGVGVGNNIYIGADSYAAHHYTSSDSRLKTAIRDLPLSAHVLQQLRPVVYEWRRDEFPSRQFRAGTFAGFLADELEQVLPTAVSEDGEGFKTVEYAALLPYVVQTLQELRREVDALRSRVEQLEHVQM